MHCWDRTWRRVFCDKSVITLIPFHRNRDRSRQFYKEEPFRALISNSMSVSKTKSAMARWASWPSLYPLESSSPRQAGIHSWFPRSLFLRALGLGQYAFGFLLPVEYFFHIHAGFLHHLGIEVRVDVGRSLVVRVAQYFHGNQRFRACLKQQRRAIVPRIMRRNL